MVNIGVLGAGHLGKIHIKLLKEIKNVNLVGFYDVNPAVCTEISESYNIPSFETLEKLLEKVDAIDIVTPTLYHYELAAAAIKRSKHVFIEKPVTNTLEEAHLLEALAKEAGVKVQIGHVERFNPAFLAAKQYFKQPLFIESHRLAQFNPRGTDVSVVLDLMIHDIDIVLSVVKSNIKRISASGVAVISDTPDITNARIEFDNGCVANLTSSRISMKNMRKTRFFQRDAYIAVDFLKKKSEIIRLKAIEGVPDPLALTIDLGENKGIKQIYFENPEVEEVNSIKLELELFAEAILQNKPTPVTLKEGVDALSVAHQIIEKVNASAMTSIQ